MQSAGRILIITGIILIAAGIVIVFFKDKLNWFGHLPGDVRIEKPGFGFYAPLMSMLIISIIISLILWIIRRFFQ